jgi:hypothetical protein
MTTSLFNKACALALLLTLAPVFAVAQNTDAGTAGAEDTPWFRQTPDSNKYALIIVGAAANDEIRQRLRGWASDLHSTLRTDYGYDS